jgi:hypothetical protein
VVFFLSGDSQNAKRIRLAPVDGGREDRHERGARSGVLIQAVKELSAESATLRAEINELKAR